MSQDQPLQLESRPTHNIYLNHKKFEKKENIKVITLKKKITK